MVERLQVEDYGPVISVRAWYRGGPEVEYGIAGPTWLSQPLDKGTRQVLSGGTVILYERASAAHTHFENNQAIGFSLSTDTIILLEVQVFSNPN